MGGEKIRIPKQQRSIEKRNLIKKTALELFSLNGYGSTTSNEIARKAGLSIGTFYSYFRDKDAVYEELVHDFYTNTMSKVPAFFITDDINPSVLLKKYILSVLKEHEYMKDFQKQIEILSKQSEKYYMLESKYRAIAVDKILLIMQQNSHMLRVSDLPTAAKLIQSSIEAVVHGLKFYPNDDDAEHVIDELTSMILRYAVKTEYLENERQRK